MGFADYDPFAWVYNRQWGPEFSGRVLPVIEELVLSKLPQAARILDLACGTGQLAALLAERGYRVTGLDGSEEMIRYARQNAPSVEFTVDDARAFDVSTRLQAVVSTFDSLNHIMSAEELLQVFRNVDRALEDGGLFLFDLNVEEGYRERWRGSFGIVEDDYVCVVRSRFDPEEGVAKASITIFRPNDSSWGRTELELLQRCYPQAQVVSLLEEAGFDEVETFDAQTDLAWAREPGRVFFRARKPAAG